MKRLLCLLFGHDDRIAAIQPTYLVCRRCGVWRVIKDEDSL